MRRIILTNSESGKSTISNDSPPLGIYLTPSRATGDPAMQSAGPIRLTECRMPKPGELELAELFGSAYGWPEMAGDTSGDTDNWHPGVLPGGFKVRTATFGPHFEAAMHATHSFDIDVVLSGEITITTEDGDGAVLCPGDSVLIPAVGHAWRAGPEGCRMVIVMFGVE